MYTVRLEEKHKRPGLKEIHLPERFWDLARVVSDEGISEARSTGRLSAPSENDAPEYRPALLFDSCKWLESRGEPAGDRTRCPLLKRQTPGRSESRLFSAT